MYDYDSDEYRVMGEAPALGLVAAQPQQPAPIRKMPVRTRRVDLDGDFVGWWARVRTNAPFALFLRLTEMGNAGGSDDDGKAVAAMGELLRLLPQLVSEWNFVDTDGDPLPCDATGMAQLPMELINTLMGAIGQGEPVPKA